MTTQNNKEESFIFRRSIAAVIDYLVLLALLVLFGRISGNSPEWSGNPFLFVFNSMPGFFVTAIAWLIYFPVIEALLGYTLAKGLFDLVVVPERRTDFPFIVTLKRHLLDPIDFLSCGVPALILVVSSNDHKRLGDYWAKSRVVKEGTRIPMFLPTDPAVPLIRSKVEY